MTKEEKIKLAEEAGLVYSGDNEEGNPEFIGEEHKWRVFENMMDSELINESNRQISEDKVFGED